MKHHPDTIRAALWRAVAKAQPGLGFLAGKAALAAADEIDRMLDGEHLAALGVTELGPDDLGRLLALMKRRAGA